MDIKRLPTRYKNNSGLIAKMKVSKYKKACAKPKISVSKSATILILDR